MPRASECGGGVGRSTCAHRRATREGGGASAEAGRRWRRRWRHYLWSTPHLCCADVSALWLAACMASILELLPLLAQLAPLFDPLPPVPYRRDRPSRQLLHNVLPLGPFALDHLYDYLRGTAQGEQTRRWVSSHTPPWYTHIKRTTGPVPFREPHSSQQCAHMVLFRLPRLHVLMSAARHR